MPVPLPRRSLSHVLLGAVLLAAPAAAALAPGAPGAPALRAVVAYDGAAPALAGVQVLTNLPSVRALVVEGTPDQLARVARTPGVRGVAPDTAVRFTGADSSGDHAVRAAQGLAAPAGRAGAGAGARIAVVDTGVSDTPALNRRSGRLIDAVDTSSSTPRRGPLTDGYGHGTFMASLIAGGPADGVSGAPVGLAPGATVLVVRVAEPDGSTSLSQVVRGLDWVAGHAAGVDVANLSFSHTRPGSGYGADPLTEAVERVRDAGVTVVVSAGNDPDVVGDPGFTPRAMTVGAADLTAKRASVAPFSGSDVVAGVAKPDLVASGVSVLGVLPPSSVIARGNRDAQMGERLWRGSGTSQATAVTSGAVALLLAEHPEATPRQVKTAFRSAAARLHTGRDRQRAGAGLLELPTSAEVEDALEPSAGAGNDGSGEGGFDANSWSANSWSANSWSANSWSANSWSANSWSANSWSSRWAGR